MGITLYESFVEKTFAFSKVVGSLNHDQNYIGIYFFLNYLNSKNPKTYTLVKYLILREESVPDEVEDGGEKRA